MEHEILTLAAAAAVTGFHIWASRRSPQHWHLGGIVPLLWIGAVAVLGIGGMISLREDWKMLLFPTAILLLIWGAGQQAARKRELENMHARDL